MVFVLSQVHSSPFHAFAPWPPNLLRHLTLLYYIDKALDTWITTAEPNVSVQFFYLSISNTVANVLYFNKINRLMSNLSTNQLHLYNTISLNSFTCAVRPCFLNYKCQTVNLKMRLTDGRPSPPYLTACKWVDKKKIYRELDWEWHKSRSRTSCAILDVIDLLRLVLDEDLNRQACDFEARRKKWAL
jgi:hypothetical protein